jgi:hypothetical protein
MSSTTRNWLNAFIERIRSKAHARSKPPEEPFSPASGPPRAAYAMSNEGLMVSYGRGFDPLTLNPFQSHPSKQFKTSPAPQHPLAPEKDPPPLDWDSWSSMARETQRRGWSFARYAARGPTGNMACLFGIVRGPFGIAKLDFYINDAGRFETLHSITHLPSGFGHGLFTDLNGAAIACEIAEQLADDWETFDVHQSALRTREAILHMHQAWTAAGINKCVAQAHTTADTNSAPLPIWFHDYTTVVTGRPQGKLS